MTLLMIGHQRTPGCSRQKPGLPTRYLYAVPRLLRQLITLREKRSRVSNQRKAIGPGFPHQIRNAEGRSLTPRCDSRLGIRQMKLA
jgi:hypothetical protein